MAKSYNDQMLVIEKLMKVECVCHIGENFEQ